MISKMSICVAHLVRHSNDIAALRAFVDSYRVHAAGIPHELLIIFKGFRTPGDVSAHEALLEGIAHRKAFVDDSGYDIGSYLNIGRQYEYEYFLFLNSFCRIERSGWLEAMAGNIARPGVGIVGATGSWQSARSDYYLIDAFHPRHKMVFYKRWIIATDLQIKNILINKVFNPHIGFPLFPNYHIRTNAFLIARKTWLNLTVGRMRNKWDALRFESGARGMTRQILRAGHEALVVGADGRGYKPEAWLQAGTFWIKEQENLLVSDNQTRTYAKGDAATRASLSHHAWRRFPDGREGSVFVDPWPK
jgi:hypothetical protein